MNKVLLFFEIAAIIFFSILYYKMVKANRNSLEQLDEPDLKNKKEKIRILKKTKRVKDF
ncbi:MAG TPA: hypothetical protein P5264_01925 [Mangrovimonas sp.]|nr:hypothetical protein [Mangrovimonas sp.]